MPREKDLSLKLRLEEFLDAVCEVNVMGNELTIPCRLSAVLEQEDGSIAIELRARRGMDMPPVKYGASLKVALHKPGKLLVLGGEAYIANSEFWRVVGIKLFNDFERRGFYRVGTNAWADVALWQEDQEGGEGRFLFPSKARLVNISLSGVLFLCEENYRVGDVLCLRELVLNEEEAAYTLFCQVRHLGELTKLGMQYRCSFINVSARDTDRLCRSIFRLQQKMIQKMRGTS